MPKRALLVGFRSTEFNAFREEGVDIRAWIQVRERREPLYSGAVETHDHYTVVRSEVTAAFRSDLKATLRREVRAAAFDAFRRHYSRIAFARGHRLRSWGHLDNQFHIGLNFHFDLLMRHRIDTVVFSNFPHEGTLIILYHLARRLGIETVIACQAAFPGRLWIVRDIEDYGRFDSVPGEGRPVPLPEAPAPPFYMKRSGHYRQAIGMGGRMARESAKLLLKIPSLKLFNDSDSVNRNLNRLTNAWDKFRLGEPSPEDVAQDVDLNRPFVYFPLHLQPEMTTDTLGFEYGDQLLALEDLSASLPEGMLIYAKENPAQSRFMRETSFFRRLRALPNVRYLSYSVPSFDLIRRSACVASITGTAGWEALLLGKSAIHFGVAWYGRLPGAFRWTGPETLAAALDFSADPAALRREFEVLSGRLYSGVLDRYYGTIVDRYDATTEARKAVAALASVLRAPAAAGRAAE